jgi:hypothetical protein
LYISIAENFKTNSLSGCCKDHFVYVVIDEFEDDAKKKKTHSTLSM